MKDFKGTKNWRIREHGTMFFIEGELPNPQNNHYPRVEVMMDDFGDHNGYTDELRRADANLIVTAPILLENLIRLVDRLEENDLGNMSAVKRAKEAISKAKGE